MRIVPIWTMATTLSRITMLNLNGVDMNEAAHGLLHNLILN